MIEVTITGNDSIPQQAEPILCYVSGHFAYFTTQALDMQWGDDWNDAPYEHNAGIPYDWQEDDEEPRWDIIVLMWVGDFATPDEYHINSPYSVEMINRGDVAWLRPEKWVTGGRPIPAGTTISEFKKRIKEVGGCIWVQEL